MARRRVNVVPHTHWDREWYEPFQTFRMRLVETLDQLLDLLEHDASYAHFHLDGQMAVVDDYLEVRPERAQQLRRLTAAGRISLGPWYILMDEFLVSGETLIRDLQLGMERAAAFGGASPVGYLPDMFGHVAQMPQLLALAGMTDAVVWRGVPEEVQTSGFWWRAPDGTTVRAEYLLDGYGNGASLPDDAKRVVDKLVRHVAAHATSLDGDVLFMNGSDHLPPQRFLGRVLAEANEAQDEYEFVITGLEEHLARASREQLDEWTGELRSGSRANVLMGVLSNRVDVKLAAALCEEALERRAEPLTAMFVAPHLWPGSLLDLAWREVIRNAAHDSICACSVDEVGLAVLNRFSEARQVASGLAVRALRAFGDSLRNPGHGIANTSARARGGLVEVVLQGEGLDESSLQVTNESTALPGELVFDAATAANLIGLIQSPRLDDDAWIESIDLDEGDDEVVLSVRIGPFERADVDLESVRARVGELLASRPTTTVRVRLEQPTIRRVLARSAPVPGLGWRRFEPAALANPVAVREDGTLDNGLVSVVADGDTGTFSIDGVGGFGRLVDGGDFGDSYNYSPPATDTIVDRPHEVDVEVVERGPVRGSLRIVSVYRWPERVDPTTNRRVGETTCEVTTRLEVVADEPYVRCTTTFVNPSRDHRLRVHFPTIQPARGSVAECAFGTVTRGLTAQGRPGEFGLPTFPSRRFVSAGRVTVAHRGLHEYEVTAVEGDAGHELALTVVRSTGMLSRLGMSMRPLPAGPLLVVDGLQLVGAPISATYAVGIDVDDPYAMCTDVLTPLEVVTAPGGGDREDQGALLSVDGPIELSSVRLVDGLLEVRVFNPHETPSIVRLAGRHGWTVDLRGHLRGSFDGHVELGPWEIATLRVADGPTGS